MGSKPSENIVGEEENAPVVISIVTFSRQVSTLPMKKTLSLSHIEIVVCKFFPNVVVWGPWGPEFFYCIE